MSTPFRDEGALEVGSGPRWVSARAGRYVGMFLEEEDSGRRTSCGAARPWWARSGACSRGRRRTCRRGRPSWVGCRRWRIWSSRRGRDSGVLSWLDRKIGSPAGIARRFGCWRRSWKKQKPKVCQKHFLKWNNKWASDCDPLGILSWFDYLWIFYMNTKSG